MPAALARFRVLYLVDGNLETVLYDGSNGGDARRWWEHYRARKGPQHLEFWHGDVLRDTYIKR